MRHPLSLQARDIARHLSHNDRQIEAEAKYTLIELAQALDRRTVTVHRKPEGMQIVNAAGHARLMTWRERLAYRLARALPERV